MSRLCHRKRSNTWIVFGSFGVAMLAAAAYGIWFRKQTGGRYDALMAGLFGLPFLATALAQWRSGYLWANLREGNRGAHRAKAPGRFLLSCLGHLLTGAGIIGWAVWRFLRGG